MSATSPSSTRKPSLGVYATLGKLIRSPEQVIFALDHGGLSDDSVLRFSLKLSVIASLFFALDSVMIQPTGVSWTTAELLIRLSLFALVMFLVLIPLAVSISAVCHQMANWFFDGKLGLYRILELSMLSVGYYDVLFAISLPLFWLYPVSPLLAQGLLFILNLITLLLSLRLYAKAYQVSSGISPRRSWLISAFPLLIILLAWGATLLLTQLAMAPHLRAG